MIKYWEGIYKNKHDFVYENNAVEIKTTKNQSRLDIKISNENQLLSMNNEKLELVVYKLDKVEAGKSIYDLANEIFSNKICEIPIEMIEKYTKKKENQIQVCNMNGLVKIMFTIHQNGTSMKSVKN